jgi:amino acid permease
MAIRYFGKAYAVGGKFVVAKHLTPKFGANGASAALSPNVFILVSMLSTAYMAHFNAPKFYTELKDNTIDRFNTVVSSSFGISIALFAVIASLGFLTFGSAANGLILNNYANSDGLMGLSRIAVFVSLVFSYPLAFVGVRDGVLDMLKIEDRSNKKLNMLTVACLAGITGLALTLKDVSFVLAFGGATLGNALIYIFPALMFRGAVNKMKDAPQRLKNEVKFALGSATLGLGMGLVGAKMALKSVLG